VQGPINITDVNVLGMIEIPKKKEIHADFDDATPLQHLADSTIDKLWTEIHDMSEETRNERAKDVHEGRISKKKKKKK
jgi:hypothetical protein